MSNRSFLCTWDMKVVLWSFELQTVTYDCWRWLSLLISSLLCSFFQIQWRYSFSIHSETRPANYKLAIIYPVLSRPLQLFFFFFMLLSPPCFVCKDTETVFFLQVWKNALDSLFQIHPMPATQRGKTDVM